MNEFDIEQNAYLTSEIHGYYHQLYTGYGNPVYFAKNRPSYR